MRRLRISATMRAQLADLSEVKNSSKRVGGVMVIPRMLSVEEWEKQAMASQAALIAAARDDPNAPVVIEAPEVDPADRTDAYKMTTPYSTDAPSLEDKVLAGKRAYAAAVAQAARMGSTGARGGRSLPRGSR